MLRAAIVLLLLFVCTARAETQFPAEIEIVIGTKFSGTLSLPDELVVTTSIGKLAVPTAKVASLSRAGNTWTLETADGNRVVGTMSLGNLDLKVGPVITRIPADAVKIVKLSGGGAAGRDPAPEMTRPAREPPAAAADKVNYPEKIDAAMQKAVEYLFSRQRNQMMIFHFTDRVAKDGNEKDKLLNKGLSVECEHSLVDAEWKDVVLQEGGLSVKVKGKTYNNVIGILPAGWFGDEPYQAPDVDGNLCTINGGGQSALATLALLAAGVNPKKDKRLARAIESVLYMHTRHGKGGLIPTLVPGAEANYAVSLQICALEYALRWYKADPMGETIRKALATYAVRLTNGYVPDGGYAYTYAEPPKQAKLGEFAIQFGDTKPKTTTKCGWDMSNTQYGLLGLWAADRARVEMKDDVWRHFNQLLLRVQEKDGSWAYEPGATAGREKMTAAGVASLFVLLDVLHTRTRGVGGPDITPFDRDPLLLKTIQAVERGMEYYGRNFKPRAEGYLLYGTERIGVAGGHKHLGAHEWFREGADVLLDGQHRDGSWSDPDGGDICGTAWSLMFLAYGRAPVLINKLRWGPDDDWSWNNYPRDCANIADWFGRTYETPVNWQVVRLDREEDLFDAPILYVTGYKRLNLTDGEVAMLRRYIDRGGTLLFADCGRTPSPFARSVTELAARLYPAAEGPARTFQPVPATHPIFTGDRKSGGITRHPMRHLDNGVRSVAFLSTNDLGWLWHGYKATTNKEAFELIANLKNYCTDRSPVLRPKLAPSMLFGEAAHSGADRGTVSVGVVKLPDKNNWNAAPAAWTTFSPWLKHVAGCGIREVRGVELDGKADLKGFDVLHLAGSGAFTLSAEAKAALKAYLRGGGKLLAEPIGAVNGDFAASALALMRELFPDAVNRAAPGSAVVTGAGGLRPVRDAGFSRAVLLSQPDLRNPADALFTVELDGRTAVLLSRFDISLALCEQSCWNRSGFAPRTARELTANFLLAGKRP